MKARLSSQPPTVGTAFWWVCTVQQHVASLWGGPCHAGPPLTSPHSFRCLSSPDQVCPFLCSPTAWAATPHKQTEQDIYTIPSSHNPVKEKWRKWQSENKMINYMKKKKKGIINSTTTLLTRNVSSCHVLTSTSMAPRGAEQLGCAGCPPEKPRIPVSSPSAEPEFSYSGNKSPSYYTSSWIIIIYKTNHMHFCYTSL